MPGTLPLALAVFVVGAGLGALVVVLTHRSPHHRVVVQKLVTAPDSPKAAAHAAAPVTTQPRIAPATTQPPAQSPDQPQTVAPPGADGAFAAFASQLGGSSGIAVAPLGDGPVEAFGALQVGHAWSTMKVPVLVTLLRDDEQQSEMLSPVGRDYAARALENSDNSAAQALFGQLEQSHGGLDGSRNGVRLANQLVQGTSQLPPGIAAGIGPFTLRIEGSELVIVDERGGQSLTAQQVAVQIGALTILHPTSLAVAPGEFTALIGPSGSGKTTLLKCLAGVAQPSAGRVLVGGDPLELRLTEVGYVPQSDVVHARLRVDEALHYAGRLRLPTDTRPQELEAAADDVLRELRLSEHGQSEIGRLSGGQRKRVACGVELIGKPTMLLLDEPTSGLDPALERRLMTTLRRLSDSGRGIVVVTHATSSLALCDTVAVMAPGGHLLFAGSPQECLEYFHVDAYDEIYNAIELTETPPASSAAAIPAQPRAHTRLLSGRSLAKHTAALTGRYAKTLTRDRRTLAILLGQAPVMAILIALLYPSHLLALPDRQPTRSAQFVFLLVTAALWLGLIDSCREIVKERSIILRELAVGVRLDAYLLSKAFLLFLLAAAQCLLLLGTAALLQPLHTAPAGYLWLATLLILTSWATAGIGLVVSSVARSVDQATSLIPLLLIPQLLFGAALVPYARMSGAIKVLSNVMVSRWAFAGAGHAINVNARLADAPQISAASGYGGSFFSLSEPIAAVILAGFTAAMLLLAAMLLASRARQAD